MIKSLTEVTAPLNDAGGATHVIKDRDALIRFITIGTDGPSFYVSQRLKTERSVACLDRLVSTSPSLVLQIAAEYGVKAPKRSYALFAVARVAAIKGVKPSVVPALRALVRTGTDLFEFVSYATAQRGWGRSLKRDVDTFLAELPADKLALWTVKYRNREGWTWDDLLRVVHPTHTQHQPTYRYVTRQESDNAPDVIRAYEAARNTTDEATLISLVTKFNLPWEALGDEQRSPAVWGAILPKLGDWALVRNLANLTRNGVLKPLSDETGYVVGRLGDLKGYHPIKLMEAAKVYSNGGAGGKSRGVGFTPVPEIVRALGKAWRGAFITSPATGKRFFYGVDVSGSMTSAIPGGVLSAAEVATALALVASTVESRCLVGRFDNTFDVLNDLPPSFDGAFGALYKDRFGGTDARLPIRYALDRKIEVDAFTIITDNDTWMHGASRSDMPSAWLKRYREAVNPDARLIVLATENSPFSIADPDDPYSLDISGFTSDVVDVMQSFVSLR